MLILDMQSLSSKEGWNGFVQFLNFFCDFREAVSVGLSDPTVETRTELTLNMQAQRLPVTAILPNHTHAILTTRQATEYTCKVASTPDSG